VSAVADRLLTAEEVAEMLSVPVGWVREHTRTQRLPHVRLGRYVRYRREAVVAWVEEQEQGGAAWRKHRPKVAG
jgi:excisionase family DNA binding protein